MLMEDESSMRKVRLLEEGSAASTAPNTPVRSAAVSFTSRLYHSIRSTAGEWSDGVAVAAARWSWAESADNTIITTTTAASTATAISNSQANSSSSSSSQSENVETARRLAAVRVQATGRALGASQLLRAALQPLRALDSDTLCSSDSGSGSIAAGSTVEDSAVIVPLSLSAAALPCAEAAPSSRWWWPCGSVQSSSSSSTTTSKRKKKISGGGAITGAAPTEQTSRAESGTGESGPPSMYDVFLGGSCGNTVWRRDLVIPFLQKRGISYYDPQRSSWSPSLVEEERTAKESSSLFLFVLDPASINATSFLEIAHLAARRSPRLVVVFLGRSEWKEAAHPADCADRLRTCALLDEILARHHVPMLADIEQALLYVEHAIIGRASWRVALAHPRQRLVYVRLRCRRLLAAVRTPFQRLIQAFSRNKTAVLLRALLFGLLLTGCALPLLLYFPFYLLLGPLMSLDVILVCVSLFVSAPSSGTSSGRSTSLLRAKTSSASGRRASAAPYALLSSATVPPPPPVPSRCRRAHPQLVSSPNSGSNNNRKNSLRKLSSRVYCETATATAPAGKESSKQTRTPPPLSALSRTSTCPAIDSSNNFASQQQQQCCPLPSPFGSCRLAPFRLFDVLFSSSSPSYQSWIHETAGPFLARHGVTYFYLDDDYATSDERRAASHILYYVPNTRTFLSGMVEIAYYLGQSALSVTICVPPESEILYADERHDDLAIIRQRNECYQIAFCYLKDMAARRSAPVFQSLSDALQHVVDGVRKERDSRLAAHQHQPTFTSSITSTAAS